MALGPRKAGREKQGAQGARVAACDLNEAALETLRAELAAQGHDAPAADSSPNA